MERCHLATADGHAQAPACGREDGAAGREDRQKSLGKLGCSKQRFLALKVYKEMQNRRRFRNLRF